MTYQRRDEWLVELDVNTSGVLDSDEENDALSLAPIACSPDAIKRQLIDDERKPGTSQGALAPIPGLWDISTGLTAYVEGIRTVPAAGAIPTWTAQANMVAAAAQQAVRTMRTAALAGATTTVIAEDVNDGHALSAATDIGLVAINGELRPYVYTAATDTLTLLIALSTAPGAGDQIGAGIVFRAIPSWDDLPYPLVARISGNEAWQNYRAWGGVASLSIGAIGPDEVPQIEATMMFPEGEGNYVRARPAFGGPRPSVWAGGSIIMAAVGSTAPVNVCGRIEWKLATAWQKVTCPALGNGVQNWIRGPIADEAVVTIHGGGLEPSDITGAHTDWLEALEDLDTPFACQLLSQYGTTLGAIAGCYGPDMVLTGVEQGTLDDLDARVLTFKPRVGAQVPWIWGMS